MNKLIKSLFIRFVIPLNRLFFFARYIFLSAFCISVITQANAAQLECAEERSAVAQAFTTNLPADPQRVKSALILRRQGEVLCQQGDAESGRAKLIKAATALNPDSIKTDLANNQKGESDE
jgi:hypothetical protein